MAKRKKSTGGNLRPTTRNLVVPRTIIRASLRKNIVVPTLISHSLTPISEKTQQARLRMKRRLTLAKQYLVDRPTRSIPTHLKEPISLSLKAVDSYRTDLTPCESRSVRAEVLHALKKTGKGAPKHKNHYKRDENSKRTC